MSEPYQILEQELGRWCGRPDTMVVCNSGTAALHLALEALRLPPGSEVLVPEFTFVACARAVVLAGLTPVFVDCDDRLLMDFLRVCEWADNGDDGGYRRFIGAFMAVHVYGRRQAMDQLIDLRSAMGGAGVHVVEDLAEAHGVRPHPSTDAACWSFYRNKVIAGEEGGAVAFLKPEHAELARSLRSQGYSGGGDWIHRPRGMNYRMTNAQAELILQSLWQYDGTISDANHYGTRSIGLRREIESWYEAECPLEWRMPYRDVPWMYDLRVPGLDYTRQAIAVKAVQALGIAARCGFKPMSSQEEFKNCRRIGDAKMATRMSQEIIALPIEPGRTTPESVRAAFIAIQQALGS